MRTALPALAALACGCGDPAGRPEGAGSGGPGEPVVALDPLPAGSRARLARLLRVQADEPVRAVLTLDDGQGHRRVVEPDRSGTDFELPLPGFRPLRHYEVTVELRAVPGDRRVAERVLSVDTGGLGSPAPELELRVDRADPARGDTLFPVRGPDGGGLLLMVDAEGEPIWALDGGGVWWRTVRQLDGGKLLLIADNQVVLTDWGDLEPVAYPSPPGLEGYHHEVIPRPEGGFFALNAAPLAVEDLPPSYAQACEPGGPATIWDSVVVEADADGLPIRTWSLGERLDTHRLGWNSLDPTPLGPDWGHANGMQYLPEEDALLISMRNQDLVLQMSRSTGAIDWILSNPWGWGPSFEALRLQPEDPDLRWPFHAHGPEWRDGRLLLHDNAAQGDMPCGPRDAQPRRTRIVEYAIDPESMALTELWSWENGLFSAIMGDADRVGGGRVLATYGQLVEDEQGRSNASFGRGDWSSRLIEFDPQSGEVWWDLAVFEADRDENPEGFRVPRSQRIDRWWTGGGR